MIDESHPEAKPESEGTCAKLPKLLIAEFKGSYGDWLRFWNQYQAIVDANNNLSDVTKFGYLKGYLAPNVRSSVDGLPFTKDGYAKAKEILMEKYGNDSEIINAYVEEIVSLPTINTSNPSKIHAFFDKLRYSVQSLETLKKLNTVNGYVRMTLNKLPGIRGDLVRTDPQWRDWDFVNLVKALKEWVERNPIDNVKPVDEGKWRRDKPSRVFNTQQKRGQQRQRTCVYCDCADHKTASCTVVASPDERKKELARKRLCFNCAGPSHRAAECKSTVTCKTCGKRHHSSICDSSSLTPVPATTEPAATTEPVATTEQTTKELLATQQTQDSGVVYPVVLVEVDGIRTRALLDTGAGSSYASQKLIDALQKKPKEVKTKQIEMMMGSTTMKVEVYSANLKSIDGAFSLNVDLTKVEKPELMRLDNPGYKEILSKYSHMNGVHISDDDTKPTLPIHVVLGASEYAAIKTTTPPRVGKMGQPVAEKTLMGWTLMSPGQEDVVSPLLLTQSTTADYKQLCALDVLGLEDKPENDQDVVYQEFKEQLSRHPDGWYAVSLPWKGIHPSLPSNKIGSQRRLANLIKKLKRDGDYEKYDDVIQEQLKEGIIEPSPEVTKGKEFYIPHKGVKRQDAESTKLRIVYDASARETTNQPSLNDCLHPGPPLQNKIWNVLVQARFHPVIATGDIQKAFLQVRIKEAERDSLRFHWRPPNHTAVEVYRFTRALFGLTSSPFLLGGVISEHLNQWESKHPDIVRELREGLYVDDLLAGGSTVEEVGCKKQTATEIFNDASFTLHKWHSNAKELEGNKEVEQDSELSYAKQQLGSRSSETKILGVPWDKENDTLKVKFPCGETPHTKREVLSNLARIYDPLGLSSPQALTGKLIYRDICDSGIPWDAVLPEPLRKRWERWWNELPEYVVVERALAPHQQPIQEVVLHAFGDASTKGVCAAVYAVVKQENGTTQGLVSSKSRLAKRDLTIPRLELIAGHMAVNLITNVRQALTRYEITMHCWLDSTVALYWIKGQGEYRQFVANRVHKINQHPDVQWHHVPTAENPADIGSRGGRVNDVELWKRGPEWLYDAKHWPEEKVLEPSPETQVESRITKEVLAVAISNPDTFDELLSKHGLWKTLRIMARVRRFMHNCKSNCEDKQTGPLTTEELDNEKTWWIKRAQKCAETTDNYQRDALQLNLQVNHKQLLECRGRIEGEYPIYLPDDHPFTSKLVEEAHFATLHGGVGLTMSHVRERYWVPRLRRLVKKVRRSCWGCKRVRAKAFDAPPPGSLPSTRTEGDAPYQVIGVDFAGPIRYRTASKSERKAYLALYGCSLTRGVYLDLLPSLKEEQFIVSLKRFIARRGRPKCIYSDNGSTFKAAAKWLKKAQSSEKFNNDLARQLIVWKFNLSRAAWWGGQFERLIGLFKSAFYKTIGNATLRWSELEEVIIDVEIALNNRPLTYMEDDVELSPLTPNSMINVRSNEIPHLEAEDVPVMDLRKRARYLARCKEMVWNRWSKEYVRNLREKHRSGKGNQTPHPKVGEVVLIRGEAKNRNKWKMGIVERLIKGRDGIIRGAKIKTNTGVLERATQHLCPLELTCDESPPTSATAAPLDEPRPRRDAACAAALRIQNIAEDNSD